eukprot:6497420-Alexandrium_andersonii.AAC.1
MGSRATALTCHESACPAKYRVWTPRNWILRGMMQRAGCSNSACPLVELARRGVGELATVTQRG